MVGRRLAHIFTGAAMALALAGGAQAAAKVGTVPAGAEVLFASGMAGGKDPWGFAARELWVAGADGSNPTQITFSGYAHNHFAMSPNRRWIFTNRYSHGDTTGDKKETAWDFKELWLIDLQNHTETLVLPGVDGGYGGVAWSPDSKTVYFTVRHGQSSDVIAWNIDGKSPMRNVTANINTLLGMPGDVHWVSDVDASPDGKSLAMVYSNGDHDDPANKRKNRIALYALDGKSARLVTDGGPLAPGMYGAWAAGDFDPDFSPDSKAISFQRATDVKYLPKRGVYTSDLMRQNLDGTGLTLLSPKNNQLQAGISSYGGPRCQVVWAVWSDDEPAHLETANPDGTDRREIRFKGDASHVQWIPVDNAAKACK